MTIRRFNFAYFSVMSLLAVKAERIKLTAVIPHPLINWRKKYPR